MCGDPHPAPTGVDEFVVDTPRLRAFIDHVNAVRHSTDDVDTILARIRPAFTDLLAHDDWLPARYQESAMTSGMGQGIGMWLLYRAGDGGLAFSALVVPPGVQTPVHDHLAWGLVGLYCGEQDEDVFARHDEGIASDRADLTLTLSQRLHPGDFYELRPENDIHRVRTVSAATSVSLHLLGNDNGCIWRHRYFPDEGRVEPFRSGYVNVDCQAR